MVSGELSVAEGEQSPSYTYTEQFNKAFPYYLSIGMTPDQYWDGDPTLAKYYRQADEIRLERKNQELWLQGMYVYEAILDVAPVLHAFAKKGTKPRPYSEQPYAITDKMRREEEEAKEKRNFEKGMARMKALMGNRNQPK